MKNSTLALVGLGGLVVVILLIVVGNQRRGQALQGEDATGKETLAQLVTADGSSTVFPISEAAAEEFGKATAARVTVGTSGTGGGFKKFCAGEIDISNASRPIKQTEMDACGAAKVEFIELPIAFDGIAVTVNPRNTWVDYLTVAELKKIWEPAAQGKVLKWSDVRVGWPAKELHLFGPGTDSGTFDYFTEAIVGKEDESRGDFTASEDDNVLVQGVASDEGALGFFGVAYYESNKDKLKVVPIDDGKTENGTGPILPAYDNILGGSYQPLARPLFMYVSKGAVERAEVGQFIRFFLERAEALVKDTGYVALSPQTYTKVLQKFDARQAGTVFVGGSQVGVTIDQILGGR